MFCSPTTLLSHLICEPSYCLGFAAFVSQSSTLPFTPNHKSDLHSLVCWTSSSIRATIGQLSRDVIGTTQCPVPTPSSRTQDLRPGQPPPPPPFLSLHTSAVVWQRPPMHMTRGVKRAAHLAHSQNDMMLLYCTCRRFCTLHDKIAFISFFHFVRCFPAPEQGLSTVCVYLSGLFVEP